MEGKRGRRSEGKRAAHSCISGGAENREMVEAEIKRLKDIGFVTMSAEVQERFGNVVVSKMAAIVKQRGDGTTKHRRRGAKQPATLDVRSASGIQGATPALAWAQENDRGREYLEGGRENLRTCSTTRRVVEGRRAEGWTLGVGGRGTLCGGRASRECCP